MFTIDADAHVMEDEAAWAHLDPAFHLRRPVAIRLPEDTSLTVFNAAWLIDEKVRLFGASPPIGARTLAKKYSLESQTLSSVAARLADMDKRRTSVQVVHTTFALLNLCEDVELEGALMRSFNTYMASRCRESGGRLRYDALVPFRDPPAAVRELRRAHEQGGVAGVFMRGIEWDRPLGDPYFYPIYEEAQRLDVPVCVHIGSGAPRMREIFETQKRIPGEEPFWPPRVKRLLGPITVQFGFYSLCETPTAIDFPNLRWTFLESAGVEWMLGAVGALERAGKKNARRLLDEGRVFVVAEPSEDLAYVANRLGGDFMVVGSDMPHQDEAAHESVMDEFESRKDLPPALMEKLLWRNASRLYRINPEDVTMTAR